MYIIPPTMPHSGATLERTLNQSDRQRRMFHRRNVFRGWNTKFSIIQIICENNHGKELLLVRTKTSLAVRTDLFLPTHVNAIPLAKIAAAHHLHTHSHQKVQDILLSVRLMKAVKRPLSI